jgi:regulatory protein YycI of two-component signal transduction system YycFG
MFDSFRKYFDTIKKSLKKLSLFFKIDLRTNWAMLITVFIIINLVLLSGQILQFYRINSDEILLSESAKQDNMNTINRTALNNIVSRFEIKDENYKSLKRNRPQFYDPSI